MSIPTSAQRTRHSHFQRCHLQLGTRRWPLSEEKTMISILGSDFIGFEAIYCNFPCPTRSDNIWCFVFCPVAGPTLESPPLKVYTGSMP